MRLGENRLLFLDTVILECFLDRIGKKYHRIEQTYERSELPGLGLRLLQFTLSICPLAVTCAGK